MLSSINDSLTDRLEVEYPYFEREQPTGVPWSGTYVETEHEFKSTEVAEFSHGIGETVQALIDVGMRITKLEEHQSVPWNAIPGQMVADGNGESKIAKQIPYSMLTWPQNGRSRIGHGGWRTRSHCRLLRSNGPSQVFINSLACTAAIAISVPCLRHETNTGRCRMCDLLHQSHSCYHRSNVTLCFKWALRCQQETSWFLLGTLLYSTGFRAFIHGGNCVKIGPLGGGST